MFIVEHANEVDSDKLQIVFYLYANKLSMCSS